jgi:nucleoside-diphosphate-sugar epimerase
MHAQPLDFEHALVTGGGGFLGLALVRQLRAAGVRVHSLSRKRYPEVDATGATSLRADLTDPEAVAHACAAAEVGPGTVVFHVAALPGVWGPRQSYWRTNVEGTQVLLDHARERCVGRFVFTSSPSAIFDGSDHRNAGNDLPYPERFLAHYPETKAEAERRVLVANGPGFATVALRPHLIFGPGDPHLVPRLLERARAGRLKVVGSGTNEVSMTFVENAAAAHVDAARALADPACPGAGRAYFINQKDPVRLWGWVERVLTELGAPLPTGRVSPALAYRAGALLEGVWKTLRLGGEPPMTRFVAQQLALDHTYDLGPAERDLGYVERVDLEQATRRTIAAFA